MRHRFASPRAVERGAALVVSLVLLLVVTILGVTSMRTTTLQERMAGNTRDRHLAFQAGEAALRAGEQWLRVPGNLDVADGHDDLNEPASWDGSGSHGAVDGFTTEGLHQANPVFHVSPPRLVRVGQSLPPEFRRIYEVTARGVGGSETAVVILQSKVDPE